MRGNNIVTFQTGIEVLLPYHAYKFDAHIFSGNKLIHPKKLDSAEPMAERKKGRINFWGELSSSDIPIEEITLIIQIDIVLDGQTKKSSGKRTVSITDI
jgi:hypothetical protein